ncbi:MAG: hypothetical protein HQ518_08265 [Rhodopirellula sp.]|nr:hypothetical protein [Rhodopirellula sp.]
MKVPMEEPPASKFCLTELGCIDNLAWYCKGVFQCATALSKAARKLLRIASGVTRSRFFGGVRHKAEEIVIQNGWLDHQPPN